MPKRNLKMITFTPSGPQVTYASEPPVSRYRRRARVWLAIAIAIVVLALIVLVLASLGGSESGSGTGEGGGGNGASPTDWPAWIAAITGVAALFLSASQFFVNARKARRLERQTAAQPGYQPDQRGYM